MSKIKRVITGIAQRRQTIKRKYARLPTPFQMTGKVGEPSDCGLLRKSYPRIAYSVRWNFLTSTFSVVCVQWSGLGLTPKDFIKREDLCFDSFTSRVSAFEFILLLRDRIEEDPQYVNI